jgi:hypothetical protein
MHKNMRQTLVGLLRPIHAALKSKTKMYGSFSNVQLHLSPLLHNQNRPEQQYKEVKLKGTVSRDISFILEV